MCLVLVSLTDGNGQGKVAETFYMLFTNFKKNLRKKGKMALF